MLIFSSAKVTVSAPGSVRVEGLWAKRAVRIRHFFSDLGLARGSVRLLFGRFVFSRSIDERTRQRIRNFFFAEVGTGVT
ncbi:MAG: hypothetical protein ACYTGB_06115 [Planctomycetota bacterium]